jgi:hypothetical protein
MGTLITDLTDDDITTHRVPAGTFAQQDEDATDADEDAADADEDAADADEDAADADEDAADGQDADGVDA